MVMRTGDSNFIRRRLLPPHFGFLKALLVLAALGFTLVYGFGNTDASRRRPAAVPPTYHVTDLGTINTNPQTGQVISHPAGINESGQVTGYSYAGTNIHAARFTNGVVEDLGTIPGGNTSTGVGINDSGQVTGDSQYSVNGGSIRHAALFSNGTVTDIGFLPLSGDYARGNGINNQTVIVGHSGPSLDTSNTRAFIWDAALGMRDIGTLGGGGYARANSINDLNQVTGEATGAAPFGGFRAFIWDQANGMRDLGALGSGSTSTGNFINENGHVVGSSAIAADNRQHAFLYDGATMRDLGAIGSNDFFSDRSFAYGVNIYDHVVGSTYRPYDGGALYQIPFIYRDDQMFDLETLADASGADYRLYSATGINDAGQIAVDAYKRSSGQYHAVLLTPNDPSTPSPTPTATPTGTPCAPTNFANPTPITIPNVGIAAPYPATIAVGALTGNVSKVTVKLINFNHTFPDDVDILLVGPGGHNAIIMSDVGGGADAVNVTITLDGAALSNLPDAGPLVSGTFKPTNFELGDSFPPPAPFASLNSALSIFNGTNPNGTWSLYIVDDISAGSGNLAGGWELAITTDDCVAPTSTPTPTPGTASISGTVTYGNAIGPNPRFVSNVLISGAGSSVVSTTTGFPDGTYSLSGFGDGSYTVTPSKTGASNGSITSFDAAKIAQHAAGVSQLTGSQLIVADTSGNGTISSFDAGQVARYAVAFPPFGTAGNWIFTPVNRTYPSVTTNIAGEDYTALLMGEVSGNWTNTGARPIDDRQLEVGSGPERAVSVRLPDVVMPVGKEIIVPVSVQDTTNKGIISYEFDLRYDSSVIQPLENPVDVAGTVSRGVSVVFNASEPGLLRVAVYGAMPLDGNGVLLNLRFTSVGAPGSVSPLTWERFMLNEGLPVTASDGLVELSKSWKIEN